MIFIKNVKIFTCDISESFHWSKLPKLKEKMTTEKFVFGSSADLSSADLSYADLRYADLRSADLSSADLSYANLRSADLRSANLSDADLSYANLRYADLSYADLRDADLSYANLRSADLRYADLRYANLRYAKLQPIDDKEVIIQDFMSVCGLGSQNRQTLIFNTNIGIVLQCGCFYGTEAQFKEKVQEKHAGTNYEQEYLKMLELAHIRFSRKQKD